MCLSTRIFFGLVRSIDLSSNKLSGEIPEEINNRALGIGFVELLNGPIPSMIDRSIEIIGCS